MVLMNLSEGSSEDAYIENKLVDLEGEGEAGTNWESSIEAYTSPQVKSDNQ